MFPLINKAKPYKMHIVGYKLRGAVTAATVSKEKDVYLLMFCPHVVFGPDSFRKANCHTVPNLDVSTCAYCFQTNPKRASCEGGGRRTISRKINQEMWETGQHLYTGFLPQAHVSK